MNSTTAREQAMKLVYEWEMGGDGGEDTRMNLLEVQEGENEYDFMIGVYEGVVARQQEIDSLISEFARGWSLDRLSRVDLAILRVAVYEMLQKTAATPVIIHEAVELASRFSSEKAGPFVNGILGSISRSGKI